MNHAPIPMGEADENGLQPVTKQKKTMTLAKAQKAADDAGFAIIRANKLQAAGIFGEFVKECGAINLGRGMLAFSAQNLDKAMETLRDLLARETGKAAEDDALRHDIAVSLAEIVEKYSEVADKLIKSAESEVNSDQDQPKRQPGFSPPPITAAKVDITVNSGGPAPTVTVSSPDPA